MWLVNIRLDCLPLRAGVDRHVLFDVVRGCCVDGEDGFIVSYGLVLHVMLPVELHDVELFKRIRDDTGCCAFDVTEYVICFV